MTITAFVLLFSLPFISGLLFNRINRKESYVLKILLTISGGFLFGTVMMHLLPEVFEKAPANAGVFVLIGFFIQLILEKFSEGIEHGHLHLEHPKGHDHHHDHTHYHKHATVTSVGLLASLSIHSLLEGMPLAALNANSIQELLHAPLFMAVIVHKIPTAIALVTVLAQTEMKRPMLLTLLGIYAIMTPTGAFLSQYVTHHLDGIQVTTEMLTALASGMLLHISATILFESTDHHRFNLIKVVASLVGALLVLLV